MKTKKHNLLCNFASLFLTSNLMQFGKVNLLFFKKHLGRNSLNHFRMCDTVTVSSFLKTNHSLSKTAQLQQRVIITGSKIVRHQTVVMQIWNADCTTRQVMSNPLATS